jgi:SAM-dependent methyltransferase
MSVSQERWNTAQTAEKNFFDHEVGRKPIFNAEFFRHHFNISSSFFSGKSILEIGCSPLASIHGIENALLKIGIEPLAGAWSHYYEKNTLHIEGIGEAMPIKQSSLDVVLCINVLDHVRNPCQVIEETKRSLKNGSVLLLWLQTYSTNAIGRKILSKVDTPHPHHFRDKEVNDLLVCNGYIIIHHKYGRANIHNTLSAINGGYVISGLKSLMANIFFRLHESAFICIKKEGA